MTKEQRLQKIETEKAAILAKSNSAAQAFAVAITNSAKNGNVKSSDLVNLWELVKKEAAQELFIEQHKQLIETELERDK